MKAEVLTKIGAEKYLMNISAGNNSIIADEPIAKGGQDKGFNPLELLAAALASCTSATIKMYAERKEWTVEAVSVKVFFDNENQEGISNFKKIIEIQGDLTHEQRERLHKVAQACPVQKILTGEINIESEIL
ncbi:MAG: OsmC family protein [Capnocytophaga sp.]|nr:OsmC family protein [Capnocytophaga sp.]